MSVLHQNKVYYSEQVSSIVAAVIRVLACLPHLVSADVLLLTDLSTLARLCLLEEKIS